MKSVFAYVGSVWTSIFLPIVIALSSGSFNMLYISIHVFNVPDETDDYSRYTDCF